MSLEFPICLQYIRPKVGDRTRGPVPSLALNITVHFFYPCLLRLSTPALKIHTRILIQLDIADSTGTATNIGVID